MRTSLLALAVMASVAACDEQTCTSAGCGPELDITVAGADGAALPDSNYTVVLELDGVAHEYECSVPMMGFDCDQVAAIGAAYIEVAVDSANRIRITTSRGNDVSAPESVRVSVATGDAAPVVDETIMPTYEKSYPNGPDCDAGCPVAEPVTFTLP